jgi:hypothetical protein
MSATAKQIFEFTESIDVPDDADLLFQLAGGGAYGRIKKSNLQLKPRREQFVLSAGQISAKQVVLANNPIEDSIDFKVSGQGAQFKTISWDFTGPNIITWNGLFLDGPLSVGMVVEATYMEA